ncbi:MAG TPA: DUF885 domain-containing protein [Gemmatimonadales bacterium]|nr:DUF885 domain-containing protein [Gemmatimonadales bacterium]
MARTDELCRSYLDLAWHFDPAAATAAGVRRYDDRLGAYDADSVRQHLAAFRSLAGAVEQLEVGELADEIDRTYLLDTIRTAVFRLEHERPHVRNPGFWLSHLFHAFHGLLKRRDAGLPERALAALGRLQATPAFLTAAAETLETPPRVLVESARRMIGGGLALLGEVEAVFGPVVAAEDAEAFREAVREARAAVERFGGWVEGLEGDAPEAGFAVGEEQFNRRLRHQHALRSSAPELWRYGRHLIEEVEGELAELAHALDPCRHWRDLVERLRAEAPVGSDLVDEYRAEMERARRFVEERELVSVPEARLEVVETPGFFRPLVPFAAYDGPGAFSEDRTGYFYVTTPDRSPGAAGSARGTHSRHEIAVTALHEGYPGHHLQRVTALGLESEVRRNLWTPLTVEGWALYCEEMMGEEGFYASLEERLFQRVNLLWRATRIVLDVGLHTRGMTPAEAVDFMLERLPIAPENAWAEVRRYCAWPAYQLCYAVGRREIRALRQAFERRAGSAFSLRRFHDELLGYGGLPVSLIRWGMGLDES